MIADKPPSWEHLKEWLPGLQQPPAIPLTTAEPILHTLPFLHSWTSANKTQPWSRAKVSLIFVGKSTRRKFLCFPAWGIIYILSGSRGKQTFWYISINTNQIWSFSFSRARWLSKYCQISTILRCLLCGSFYPDGLLSMSEMLVGFLRMRPTLRVMRTWRVSSLDTGKLKLNALLGDSIKDLRQHSKSQ